jgi:hypothetical protein
MEKVKQAVALLREANAELKKAGFRVTTDIKIVPFNGCHGEEDPKASEEN